MLGKRASPVRREAVRKGPFWHLAGGPPYRTAGSASGPGKPTRSQSRQGAPVRPNRDELTGVDIRIGSWDIRGRWFGVVVGATPRLGELRHGQTIPWRVIATQITPRESRDDGQAPGNSR